MYDCPNRGPNASLRWPYWSRLKDRVRWGICPFCVKAFPLGKDVPIHPTWPDSARWRDELHHYNIVDRQTGEVNAEI
jgi:hypothetical protein